MTKLINANNFINCLQIMSTKNDSTVWGQCIEIVNSLPDEQKHGQWVGLEYDGYADGNPVYDLWECSCCNCEWDGEEDTLPNYCPDCGAKMDEVIDG